MSGVRVLVVDDDAMVREALAGVLRERHEVVALAGARAAIAAVGRVGFDAVLCDLQLGDGDAESVCAAFAEGRAAGARGFVVMTGGAGSARLEAFVERMPHVLGKPFDFDEVLELIDRVV